MIFSKNCITTYTDVKGKCSLIFFTYGCNLHCFECHVYAELNVPTVTIIPADTSWVLDKIKEGEGFVDCVIFSGGEFLINDVDEIEKFLIEVKEIFSGKIIINTNGTFPKKMDRLSYLIDGFYLDVKAPFWLLNGYNVVDSAYFKLIYGVDYSPELILNLKKSLLFLSSRKSEYDRTRTVKYPIMPDCMFSDIEKAMKRLNLEHDFNPFVEEEP